MKLTVDGRELTAEPGEPGEPVLQVAQRAGIDIPTLCYHPALEPVEPRRRPARRRCAGFDEVELCYSVSQARREALRCLRCDLEEARE